MPDKVDAAEITVSFGLVSGVRGVHIPDEEVARCSCAVSSPERKKKTFGFHLHETVWTVSCWAGPVRGWLVGFLLGCCVGCCWASR
jgi:hypothetical protein